MKFKFSVYEVYIYMLYIYTYRHPRLVWNINIDGWCGISKSCVTKDNFHPFKDLTKRYTANFLNGWVVIFSTRSSLF